MPEPNDYYEDDADFAYEDGEYDNEINESDYMPSPEELAQMEREFRQEEKDEWLKQEREIMEKNKPKTWLISWNVTVLKTVVIEAESKEEAECKWKNNEYDRAEEDVDTIGTDLESIKVELWDE